MTWIDSKEIAKLLCITLQAVNKAAKEGKYGDKIRYIKQERTLRQDSPNCIGGFAGRDAKKMAKQ